MTKQSTRKARGEVLESDYGGQDRQGNQQTRYTRLSQVVKGEEQLVEKAVASLLNAHYFTKFTDGNLNGDSRQKSHRHGAREKIGEEPQPEDSGQKKNSGSYESNQAGKFDIPWVPWV
jgi:hypothetical protein